MPVLILINVLIYFIAYNLYHHLFAVGKVGVLSYILSPFHVLVNLFFQGAIGQSRKKIDFFR